MKLNEAECIANTYQCLFMNYCKRVCIGGSIRRKKPEVKDIELVVIPDSYKLEKHFIDNKYKINFIKNGDKYKQIILPEGIKLDLFICTPETWGMNYFIRTGSADFVYRFMIDIQKKGFCSRNALLCKFEIRCDNDSDYVVIATPDEIDVFNKTETKWVEPENRK